MIKAIIFDCFGVLYSGGTQNQELLQYIAQLKSRQIKIGLLSNISAVDINRIFGPAERQDFFDGVVISGEDQVAKPDPAAFELMASKLEVEPNVCLMVDDSPANCDGAEAVGMKALLYRSTEQVKDDINRLDLVV